MGETRPSRSRYTRQVSENGSPAGAAIASSPSKRIVGDPGKRCARAYGARTTPDVFVIDGESRLCYRGAPDADHRDDSQRAAWLRAALDSLQSGEEIARPETDPVGCSVKWKG